jgi:hypothetical protein
MEGGKFEKMSISELKETEIFLRNVSEGLDKVLRKSVSEQEKYIFSLVSTFLGERNPSLFQSLVDKVNSIVENVVKKKVDSIARKYDVIIDTDGSIAPTLLSSFSGLDKVLSGVENKAILKDMSFSLQEENIKSYVHENVVVIPYGTEENVISSFNSLLPILKRIHSAPSWLKEKTFFHEKDAIKYLEEVHNIRNVRKVIFFEGTGKIYGILGKVGGLKGDLNALYPERYPGKISDSMGITDILFFKDSEIKKISGRGNDLHNLQNIFPEMKGAMGVRKVDFYAGSFEFLGVRGGTVSLPWNFGKMSFYLGNVMLLECKLGSRNLFAYFKKHSSIHLENETHVLDIAGEVRRINIPRKTYIAEVGGSELPARPLLKDSSFAKKRREQCDMLRDVMKKINRFKMNIYRSSVHESGVVSEHSFDVENREEDEDIRSIEKIFSYIHGSFLSMYASLDEQINTATKERDLPDLSGHIDILIQLEYLLTEHSARISWRKVLYIFRYGTHSYLEKDMRILYETLFSISDEAGLSKTELLDRGMGVEGSAKRDARKKRYELQKYVGSFDGEIYTVKNPIPHPLGGDVLRLRHVFLPGDFYRKHLSGSVVRIDGKTYTWQGDSYKTQEGTPLGNIEGKQIIFLPSEMNLDTFCLELRSAYNILYSYDNNHKQYILWYESPLWGRVSLGVLEKSGEKYVHRFDGKRRFMGKTYSEDERSIFYNMVREKVFERMRRKESFSVNLSKERVISFRKREGKMVGYYGGGKITFSIFTDPSDDMYRVTYVPIRGGVLVETTVNGNKIKNIIEYICDAQDNGYL